MLVARLLPGARLELMEADGAAAAMRPAFQATATASAGAAAAAAAASRSSVSSSSSGSSGSSGSMDGPVDLASLGLVICNSPNGGGGGGGGGTSRDDSGLGVELPLRRCLVAAAAGDSLDGEDDNAAEMDLYGNGSGSSCGCVMVAAGAAAAVALNQQRQPRQQARPNESSKEVWEATEAEEAPADGATRPRYMAAGAAAGRGGAQPAPAPAPLLLPLPLPAACGHPPPRPCAPSHQATQQEQQAVGVGGEEGGVGGEEGGVGGEEGGGDAAAGWGLLTAGCDDDEDDGAVAECVLVAAHVELGGSACSVDQVGGACVCGGAGCRTCARVLGGRDAVRVGGWSAVSGFRVPLANLPGFPPTPSIHLPLPRHNCSITNPSPLPLSPFPTYRAAGRRPAPRCDPPQRPHLRGGAATAPARRHQTARRRRPQPPGQRHAAAASATAATAVVAAAAAAAAAVAAGAAAAVGAAGAAVAAGAAARRSSLLLLRRQGHQGGEGMGVWADGEWGMAMAAARRRGQVTHVRGMCN